MVRQSEPAVYGGAEGGGPTKLGVAGPSLMGLLHSCGLVRSGSGAYHECAGRGRPQALLQVVSYGSVAKFGFWRWGPKVGPRIPRAYRCPQARKANFATEPLRTV